MTTVSRLASPPLTAAETQCAPTSICPLHHGRIAHSPTPSDTEGRVFLCPIGDQFWRYTRKREGMHAPLVFPKGL